ncbi:MAG TPA: protease SohB, partial [Pasteurellaceae bacterium]|nr:protease SohB [Pasteurellaceae bacterium]
MWSDVLTGYGIFILEILTVLLVIAAIVGMIFNLKQRKANEQGELLITDLSKQYEQNSKKLRDFHLSEEALKQAEKAQKKADKAKAKEEKVKLKNGEQTEVTKPCLYVLNFKGDILASETKALREEISAIINVANPDTDEVLLRLESPGGIVHGYGLAASQLTRLKQKGIKLTVAVDKVAASGGYMMACV